MTVQTDESSAATDRLLSHGADGRLFTLWNVEGEAVLTYQRMYS